MFKRILSFLLFGVLLFSFVGCGPSEDVSQNSDGTDSQENNPSTSFEILQNGGPFKFSYTGKKTVWKRGEDVVAVASQEYLGEEVYPYKGSSSLGPYITVYCNVDGSLELTEESYGIPNTTTCTTDVQEGIQPGDVDRFDAVMHVPDDAPLGKYHIKLSFEGYYQIFENAIEIVE